MPGDPKIQVRDLRVRYGRREVIKGISIDVPRHSVFAIIGPANSGKTTFLKCVNRTLELIPGASIQGKVRIWPESVPLSDLKIGMTVYVIVKPGRPASEIRNHMPSSTGSTVPPLQPDLAGVIVGIGEKVLTIKTSAGKQVDVTTDSSTVIKLDGQDVAHMRDVHGLRRRIGMVFPLPVGLPLSVWDNVAYAPRMAGVHRRADLSEIVERCLRQAALWDEVKDRLKTLGTLLSGGQQQRLTIARALSHDPEVLCLDEFSIAIDPVTTMRIEDMLAQLKERITIILVTNLVQQARRLGDRTCLLFNGKVIQEGTTGQMFSDHPGNQLTYDYVHGVLG